MFNSIIQKILSRVSLFTFVMIIFIAFLMQDFEFISNFLPSHSKLLMMFVFACMGAMYECIALDMGKSSKKIDRLAHQMRVQSLKGAVNSMYARFEASGDEFIENEYTIKELAELRDLRDELGVNSYTQDRLEYLNSRVKH